MNADSTRAKVIPLAYPKPNLEFFAFERGEAMALPLVLATVAAGFPSPADDYIDRKLDLNEYLITHPAATFFVRVHGDSMIDAGVHSGDLLIVDRAVEPKSGHVIIAVLDGELTVKRLKKSRGRLFLVPENPEFPTVEIGPDRSFEIWGVAVHVIHKL